MFFWSKILLFALILTVMSCSGDKKPATPLETFKTYTKAIKAKDTNTMKLLLSNATVKMHEKEAKSQGVNIDDIVKRETLFAENQKELFFRDEKIDGEKATLEVKNSYGAWEKVPFVLEDGVWKIDKVGFADQMQNDVQDEQEQKFQELINGGQKPQSP